VSGANPMRDVMPRLWVDAGTVRVLRAFASAGVRSILLKGPTLERELYTDRARRPYRDTDVLVAPDNLERAGRALMSIGLELSFDHRDHSRIFEPHAQEWGPPDGPNTVDLHWRLPGVDAEPSRAWEVLVQRTVPFAIGGQQTESPDRPGLAMMVALHAAHHGFGFGTVDADLERAVTRFDHETWAAAAALATDLEAGQAFAAGLRLTPQGAALADALDLDRTMSRQRKLLLAAPPPGAFRLLELGNASGTARLQEVRAAVLPSPGFMRATYPVARRGPAGLAAAYGARLMAAVVALPGALRAVRRSRAD
jgi:hypothetical protein